MGIAASQHEKLRRKSIKDISRTWINNFRFFLSSRKNYQRHFHIEYECSLLNNFQDRSWDWPIFRFKLWGPSLCVCRVRARLLCGNSRLAGKDLSSRTWLLIGPLPLDDLNVMLLLFLSQMDNECAFSLPRVKIHPGNPALLPPEAPRQKGQLCACNSPEAPPCRGSRLCIQFPWSCLSLWCLSCSLQHIKDLLSLLATNNALIHLFSYYLGH